MTAAATALLAAVLLVVGLAGPASAHTSLLRSDPADGAVLEVLPQRVVLTFTEPVRGASAEVTGPDGTPAGAATAAQGNRVLVTLSGSTGATGAADADAGGAWSLSWQVTSRDGHDVAGALGFEVRPPAPAPPVETAPTGAAATPADPAASGSNQPSAAAVPAATGPAGPATGGPGTSGAAVDLLALVAVVVGGLALLVLLAGVLLGVPRLAPLARPAWGVVAGAGLLLVPVLPLQATGAPLSDLASAATWLGGLLSWTGLVLVLVVAAAGLLASRPVAASAPAASARTV